ncbi:MAG TPA: 16S rRNA (adenine(1518)-N(6)/adenine(1519)-N(6))-dimethyltransferase RsmA [Polyangiaceae bacterium]|nr:16S rRNA (adenine(1518)-N(6)/adenine(1519)-N(6))-dimethyltransferase RsmA [Polyangiaceae bacterium]
MRTDDPRSLLRGAGLRAKKSFGQNFLVADHVARAIAAACVPDDEVGCARVVEIGAGTGSLTRWLADRARTVIAIERDRDLVPLLEREIASTDRVRVVEADARSSDLAGLLGGPDPGSPRVLCGNLPYSLTGPLLRSAVAVASSVDRVVFMVQDEVASRLLATPSTKEWGALTVFVRAAFDARRLLRAPPAAFHPQPEVTSAVVVLSPLRPRRADETPRLRALVRGAFEARRKTLRNAWAALAPDGRALEAAAARAGVSLDARGETLDVEAFARMAQALDEPG